MLKLNEELVINPRNIESWKWDSISSGGMTITMQSGAKHPLDTESRKKIENHFNIFQKGGSKTSV